MTEAQVIVPPSDPRLLRLRLVRVAWRLLPWIGVLLIAASASILLGGSALLQRQMWVLGLSGVAFGTIRALVFEILAPERPALRMVPLRNARARRLSAALRAFLVILFVTSVGIYLVQVNGWYPSVAGVLRLLRNLTLVVAFYGLLAGLGLFRWLREREVTTFWGLLARFTGRFLVPLGLLTSLFQVVVLTLGYQPLAEFVGMNLMESGVKIVLAVIAYHYIRRGLRNGFQYIVQQDEEGERTEAEAELNLTMVGLERVVVDIVKAIVFVLTAAWVLASWEVTPALIKSMLASGIFGEGTLTWGRLLGGVTKISVVLIVSWLIRSILTYVVFPRANIEIGARYALLAVLKYVTWGLVIVFVLDALGLETGSLGWFFGAAGVGIGLGLQDIIGNFVSGLIMLIERPIRVGDVIQVGDVMGTVEDIRIRGTVIRTFDNTAVTIPNRQMLGERVTNMSYAMDHARLKVEVGVAYSEDPERVRAILLEVARAHPDVLDEPDPAVLLSNFGPSSVDLTLICHTGKVTGRLGVASDLRQRIFKTLRDADVSIPFPQIDLHVKALPPALGPGGIRS